MAQFSFNRSFGRCLHSDLESDQNIVESPILDQKVAEKTSFKMTPKRTRWHDRESGGDFSKIVDSHEFPRHRQLLTGM